MTNLQQLKLIAANYDLKRQNIADLLGLSIYRVNNWYRKPGDSHFTPVPDLVLKALKLQLKIDKPITDYQLDKLRGKK